MSETKWTPGPWFADGDGRIWRRDPKELYQNGGGVAGDMPLAIAHEGRISWENKYPVAANARLMAAAPELYAALDSIVRSAEENNAAINMPLIVAAKAALAKARGGQP